MKYLAVLACAGLMISAPAFAGTGTGSNSVGLKLNGKNATTYVDALFGLVRCNETQHPNFDTVSCTMIGGQAPLEPYTSSSVGWNSDFGNRPTGVLNYTVSADGMTYSGNATY